MQREISDKRGSIMEPTTEPQTPSPRPRKLKEGTFVWGDKDLGVETENNAGELPDTPFSSAEPKGKERHSGVFSLEFYFHSCIDDFRLHT